MLSPHVESLALTVIFVFFDQADKQEVTSISAAAKEIGLDVSVAAVLSRLDGILTFKRKANKNTGGFFSSLRKQGDLALALNASGESLAKHGGASRLCVVDKGFTQSPSEFGFPHTNCFFGSLAEGYMRPIPCVHAVFKVIALSVHPGVWSGLVF